MLNHRQKSYTFISKIKIKWKNIIYIKKIRDVSIKITTKDILWMKTKFGNNMRKILR